MLEIRKVEEILKSAKIGYIDHVMYVVRSIFNNVENYFQLIPGKIVNENNLKITLSQICRCSVKNLIIESLVNPSPKPEWMSEENYQKRLIDNIGETIEKRVINNLEKSVIIRLDKNYNNLYYSIFDAGFWEDIDNVILDLLITNFGKNNINELVLYIHSSLKIIFLYFLDNLLKNDLTKASLYEQYLVDWGRYFVLGSKVDEPGTFFVLAK